MKSIPPKIILTLVEFRFTKYGPVARITIETHYQSHSDKRDIYIDMHSKIILDFDKRPVETTEEI